jgi:hypothetical protein
MTDYVFIIVDFCHLSTCLKSLLIKSPITILSVHLNKLLGKTMKDGIFKNQNIRKNNESVYPFISVYHHEVFGSTTLKATNGVRNSPPYNL